MGTLSSHTRLFTPTQLGLSAVNVAALAITNGNLLAFDQYTHFLLVLSFTATPPTGEIRFSKATTESGLSFVTPPMIIAPFGTNSPWAMTNPSVFSFGPGGGKFSAGTGVNVYGHGAAASNLFPLHAGRFEFEVTGAGVGTMSARLWCT